jgi:DNA-binding transcriptional ArsR family regulator
MTDPCRVCAAIEATREHPLVRRALDRLNDALTIAVNAGHDPRRRSRLADADDRTFREQRRLMLLALEYGPLRVPELVDEIHGPPLADHEEQRLRVHRTRQALVRACRSGEIVRVGHGWYARPGHRQGMQHTTRGDCLRLLADPSVQPAGGLTVNEIAERLDLPRATVRWWLEELQRQRADIVCIHGSGPRGGRLYRYRVEQEGAA